MQIIFQAQFGFPQLLVPGILYGSTIQLHNHIKYIVPGETLIIIPLQLSTFLLSICLLTLRTPPANGYCLCQHSSSQVSQYNYSLLYQLPSSQSGSFVIHLRLTLPHTNLFSPDGSPLGSVSLYSSSSSPQLCLSSPSSRRQPRSSSSRPPSLSQSSPAST